MFKLASLLISLLMCLGAASTQAQLAPAEQTFYEAFYQEYGRRDLSQAEPLFIKAATLARKGGDQKLLVKALLGQARCAQALGRQKAWERTLQEVLKLDPKNREAQAAQEALHQPGGQALQKHIRTLIQQLGSSERKQAYSDLRVIGGRAVPALVRGLRDLNVAVVTGCTHALVALHGAAANKALLQALQDPQVALPEAILKGLDRFGVDEDYQARAVLLGLHHPSPQARAVAPDVIKMNYGPLGGPAWQEVLQALLLSPDRQARMRAYRGVARAWPVASLLQVLRRAARDLDPSDPEISLAAAGATSEAWRRVSGTDQETLIRPFWRHTEETLARLVAHQNVGWIAREAVAILSMAPRPLPAALSQQILASLKILLRRSDWSRANLNMLASRNKIPFLPDAAVQQLFVFMHGGPEGRNSASAWKNLRTSLAFRLLAGGDPAATRARAHEAWDKIQDDAGRGIFVEALAINHVKVPEIMAAGARLGDPQVRTKAYQAMLSIPEAYPSAPKLPLLVEDMQAGASHASLANSAILLARRFPTQEWIAPLQAIIQKEGNGWVDAIQALGAQPKRLSLPALQAILTEPHMRIVHSRAMLELLFILRDQALELVLKELARPQPSFCLDQLIWAYRGTNLYSKTPPFSHAAMLALAHRMPAKQRLKSGFLAFVLPPLTPAERRPLLLAGLQSPNEKVRTEAIRLCAKWSLPDFAAAILPLARDPVDLVRREAVRVLKAYRFNLEMERLLGASHKTSEALKSALKQSRSPDQTLRLGGILALRALGGPQAIKRLLELQSDPDEAVRQAALTALAKLKPGGRN